MSENKIKIWNKSTTRFRIFVTKDAKDGFLLPNTTIELPEAHAKKLMAMFPHDIINMASLEASIPVSNAAAEAPVAEVSDEKDPAGDDISSVKTGEEGAYKSKNKSKK